MDAAAEGEEVPYTEWEVSELKDEVRGPRVDSLRTQNQGRDDHRPWRADDDENGESESVDEAEDDEEDEGEEEAEEGLTAEEVRVMSRGDLKALNKDEEVGVKVLKSMSDEDLAEAIIEALGLEAEEEEAEEEDDEEGEEEDDEADDEADDEEGIEDYADWAINDLKTELKERGLKPGRYQVAALSSGLMDSDAASERQAVLSRRRKQ